MKKFLSIFLICITLVSFVGCSSIKSNVSNFFNNKTENQIYEESNDYLKNKYPDKTFVFVDRENPHTQTDSASNNLIILFDIVDENNDKFMVGGIVSGFGKNSFVMIDNVQQKEIKQALKEKIVKMSEIEEDEYNYFVCNQLEFANKKFDGDIDAFLNEDKCIKVFGNNQKYLCISYYYTDKILDTSTFANDEEFARKVMTLQLVEFKDKNRMPKKEIAQEIGFEENLSYHYTHIPDIKTIQTNKNYKLTDLFSFEPIIFSNGDLISSMYNTSMESKTEEYSFDVENKVDISKWSDTIKEHKRKTDETWENYQPITEQYSTDGLFMHFIPLPQNISENKTYKLFVFDNNEAKIIDLNKTINNEYSLFLSDINSFYNEIFINSCMTDNYFFISPKDIPTDDGVWFIVECY